MRRAQLSFGDGLIAGEVSDLREGWTTHADRVLADEQIVGAVYEALARRHPRSRSRGRPGAPAEVVLRLLILKHVRNWSYHVLEREVRANLAKPEHSAVGLSRPDPQQKASGDCQCRSRTGPRARRTWREAIGSSSPASTTSPDGTALARWRRRIRRRFNCFR